MSSKHEGQPEEPAGEEELTEQIPKEKRPVRFEINPPANNPNEDEIDNDSD